MRRLRRLDRLLLLIGVPLWALCFGLSAKSILGQTAFTGIYVSAHARDYPTVRFFFVEPRAQIEASGLRVGDRLLRLGEIDLRGMGSVAFAGVVAEAADAQRRAAVVYERAGERRETSYAFRSYRSFWPLLPISLAFALSAVLLLLRAPPSPTVSAIFQAFLCVAFLFTIRFGANRPETYLKFAVLVSSFTLVLPLSMRALSRFPNGSQPAGRWSRVWPWLFAPWVLLGTSGMYGFPLPPQIGIPGAFAGLVVAYATLLAMGTRNYRRADPLGRRQMRWFFFGMYAALVPVLAANALVSFEPRFVRLAWLSFEALILLPLSLLIAVVRYNLFDVDRLISATASYSALVILLALAGEVLLEPLAGRGAALFGLEPATGQVAFVVLLAAVLIPAQRAWRPYVDRIFFAEGRSRESQVEALLEDLSHAAGARNAIERSGAGIARVFRAEFCAIYERAGEVFEPTCVSGSGDFPVIPADSQAVRALETKVAPVLLDPRGARRTLPSAALVAGAAVVAPLRPGGAPLAFVAIGPKRSGDVYTSTELALLSALAHALSERMASSSS